MHVKSNICRTQAHQHSKKVGWVEGATDAITISRVLGTEVSVLMVPMMGWLVVFRTANDLCEETTLRNSSVVTHMLTSAMYSISKSTILNVSRLKCMYWK